MMFVIPFQGLIAPKRVGGIDGPLPDFGLDMPYKFPDTHRLTGFDVYAGFPLQESKGNTFFGGRSAWLPPPSPAEGCLVQLNLAFQFSTFQLSQMEQGVPHLPKDVGDPFDIDNQIPSQPIGGLELKESLKGGQLSAQPTQAFALPAERTFQMSPAGVKNLKGVTKHTLATPPKVGRTTKNQSSSSIPALVLPDAGYETPYIPISKGLEKQ
jgi:hypothetical protein